MRNRALQYLGTAFFVIAAVVALYVRFSNIAATETELFLNFLPAWAVCSMLVACGYFLFTLAERE